jgi:hypothetical protein
VAGKQNTFEWDEANREHIARHGITPEEFEEGMNGNPAPVADYELMGEQRAHVIGITGAGRMLELVYTVRRGRIRAVTAYPLKRSKREIYRGQFEK